MKSFLLVISIWSFTAESKWVYVGNNVVLDVPMTIEKCNTVTRNWIWRRSNENYKLVLSCEEAVVITDPETKKETSL